MGSGTCYEINKVGGLIVSAISEGKSIQDIANELQNAFGVGKERVDVDTDRFIDQLLAKGLIETRI
jgi:hypothetical protein